MSHKNKKPTSWRLCCFRTSMKGNVNYVQLQSSELDSWPQTTGYRPLVSRNNRGIWQGDHGVILRIRKRLNCFSRPRGYNLSSVPSWQVYDVIVTKLEHTIASRSSDWAYINIFRFLSFYRYSHFQSLCILDVSQEVCIFSLRVVVFSYSYSLPKCRKLTCITKGIWA